MEPGQVIAHYRLQARLGAGGMGEVWLAEDTRLDRPVAIRLLAPILVDNPEVRKGLAQGIRLSAALDHPNILPVHELGEVDDRPYLVTAYLKGDSLRELLTKSGDELPGIGTVLGWALNTADGLAAAHETGLVHRDIRPENLFLTADGHVRIADLGFSCVDAATRMAMSRSQLDTMGFMSPEQVQGQPTDHRTDLFSLGVTLYELLSGRKPFEGDDPVDLVHAIAGQDPVPVRKLRPDVPPKLDALVTALLQKDPERRPESAAAVARDLREALEQTGAGATIPIARELRGPRFSIRVRMVTGLLVSTAVVVTLWLSFRPRPVPEPRVVASKSVAVFPFAYQGDEELAYIAEGMVDLLSTSLGGAGSLDPVDPRAVMAQMQTPKDPLAPPISREVLDGIARRLGATEWIHGNILEEDGLFRFEGVVFQETGNDSGPILVINTQGEAGDVFAVVDDITTRLLMTQEQGLEAGLTRLAEASTDNLEALKAYLEGERLDRAGKGDQARQAFQRAVELDSTFAFAWFKLATTGDWTESHEFARKALQHQDRLSDRSLTFLKAYEAKVTGQRNLADSLLNVIVRDHPGDVDAWRLMAENRWDNSWLHGYPARDAKEPMNRFLELIPDDWYAKFLLLHIAMGENDREALSLLKQVFPNGPGEIHWRSVVAHLRNDTQGQRKVIEELEEMPGQNEWRIYFTGLYTEGVSLEGARRVYEILEQLSGAREWSGLGCLSLICLDLAEGRVQRARKRLEDLHGFIPAWGIEYTGLLPLTPVYSPDPAVLDSLRQEIEAWDAVSEPPIVKNSGYLTSHNDLHGAIRLYLLASLDVKLGDVDSALARAAVLDTIPPPHETGSILRDWAKGIRAQVAQSSGDTRTALNILETSLRDFPTERGWGSPFCSQARERFQQAELLFELGRDDEALHWFASFDPSQGPFEKLYTAPARLRQAQIHDRQGNRVEAVRQYERFIELWKDCDPGLKPQVEQARERIAELRVRQSGSE